MAILTYQPFARLAEMIAQIGWSLPTYLPVGWWPRIDRGRQGGNGMREFPIPARFDFLRGLGPCQIVQGVSFGRKHDYCAFLFERKVAVDSIGYGNAVYVFRIDEANMWEEEVDAPKFEVWSSAPSFIRKIHHSEGWENRLLAELSRP